jgi:ankyrin repeat protein
VSALDNLKKEAKRWLKAVRANDADARSRLKRAYPAAPDDPGLRDIQHALACEHGHDNWRALRYAVAAGPATHAAASLSDAVVTTFLEFACWDHHTHGKGDHRMHDRAAQRLLAQHPEIATHDLYTAIVCGNLADVRRRLAERPEAAREQGGARNWTPLLYLCYTRLTNTATFDSAMEIARLLLDAGANPNDFYMAGDSEYSCLVGAAGEGEQDSPRQPYAEPLYRLLLERGAGPYDIQVLYNTHFHGDMLWWLEMTYERSLALGRKADWDDPDWSMFGMGGYGLGAFYVLKTAVEKNNFDLAEWSLAHGADPNSSTSTHPKFRLRHTPYQIAVMMGQTRMADLLLRHGATNAPPALDPLEEFIAICMRLDRTAALAFLERHPEYRRSHLAMFEAAKRDRPDVIALLLDLGVSLEVSDTANTRALHHAAAHNALRAARFLIERGAEVDPRESSYGATPIGWAAHSENVEMMDFLSARSRNIWTLVFRGYVDRVRELLREEPALAKQSDSDGITPLWWLPDDDAKAMEMVELLIAAGADPAKKNTAGRTAADWARKRGMLDIARRLTVEGMVQQTAATGPEPSAHAAQPDLAAYEKLAQHLLIAYETGDPESIRRLADHFGGPLSWDQVRSIAPQQLVRIGVPEDQATDIDLAKARLLVACVSGYESWAELEDDLH